MTSKFYGYFILLAMLITAPGYAIPPFLIGHERDVTIYEDEGKIVHSIQTNHPIVATTSFRAEDGTPTAAVLTLQPWDYILNLDYFLASGEPSEKYHRQSVKVPGLEEELICPTLLYKNGALHAFYIDPHTPDGLKIVSFKDGSDSTLGLTLVDTFLLQGAGEIQKNNVFLTKLHDVQRVTLNGEPHYAVSASTRHTTHGGALGFSVLSFSSALPFSDDFTWGKRMHSTHTPFCLSVRTPALWQTSQAVQMQAYVDETKKLNALLAIPSRSQWGFSATDTYQLRFEGSTEDAPIRPLVQAQTYGHPLAFKDLMAAQSKRQTAASTITTLSPYRPFQRIFSLWDDYARVPCFYEVSGRDPGLGATDLPVHVPADFCPERAVRGKDGFLLVAGRELEEGLRGWLGLPQEESTIHIWKTTGTPQEPTPILSLTAPHAISHVSFFH